MTQWAQFYGEIPEAAETNDELHTRISELIAERPIHGKAVEGGDRVDNFRDILTGFFDNDLVIEEFYHNIAQELPRRESPHAHNNRVFTSDWNERLGRTHVSRFYNQAVLQLLQERGDEECFVPRSPDEDHDSGCTKRLAGREIEVGVLLDRIERIYDQADYSAGVTIPGHPNCTHTVVPTDHR